MELNDKERELLLDMIKEKTDPAWKKMETLTICRELYDTMSPAYPKEMECFKNCVFWNCVLHPDWTELQIIADVMKGTEIANLINKHQ